MRYLFRRTNRFKELLRARSILLLLDYDGTLTPIARRPKDARLRAQKKQLLLALAKSPGLSLAIISGRALVDIKRLVGIPGVVYCGNHGLEISGPRISLRVPLPLGYSKLLKNLRSDLRQRLSAIPGILIEDKGPSLSLHFRRVAKRNISRVKTIFYEVTQPYLEKKQIRISSGKMVLEIRPPVNWGKGKAALWLLAQRRSTRDGKRTFPIYAGDDRTDEDAFRALKNKGLTIFVGPAKKSAAAYYLRNTQELFRLLKEVRKIKQAQEPS